MQTKVEFFDELRELVGTHEWLAEIPQGTSVAMLFEEARKKFPELSGYSQPVAFMAGLDYVAENHTVREGETISFLPEQAGR